MNVSLHLTWPCMLALDIFRACIFVSNLQTPGMSIFSHFLEILMTWPPCDGCRYGIHKLTPVNCVACLLWFTGSGCSGCVCFFFGFLVLPFEWRAVFIGYHATVRPLTV
jgi:hypothetical protein